jgi:hypothetical protein
MNVDIIFPNCPCYLIQMVMKTSVNNVESEELMKQLTWAHLDKNHKQYDISKGREMAFPNVNTTDPDTAALIKDFLAEENKCQVMGSLDITKVTGQLGFGLRGSS